MPDLPDPLILREIRAQAVNAYLTPAEIVFFGSFFLILLATVALEMVLPLDTAVFVLTVTAGLIFQSICVRSRYRYKFATDGKTLVRQSPAESALRSRDRLLFDLDRFRFAIALLASSIFAGLAYLLTPHIAYGAAFLGCYGAVVAIIAIGIPYDRCLAAVYLVRGRMRVKSNELEPAIYDFTEARLLDSKLAFEAITERGKVYLRLEEFQQARSDFREACLSIQNFEMLNDLMLRVDKLEFISQYTNDDAAQAAWKSYCDMREHEAEQVRDELLS